MTHTDQGREVIAHFEAVYLILQWLFLLCALAGFYYWFEDIFFSGPDRDRDMAERVLEIWALVLFAGFLIYLVPAAVRVTYRLIKGRWAALWIENGRLVYVSRISLDAPLTDIAFVGLTDVPIRYGIFRNTNRRYLTVRLHSGKEVNLSTLYAENINDIVATLRQRAGLSIE